MITNLNSKNKIDKNNIVDKVETRSKSSFQMLGDS